MFDMENKYNMSDHTSVDNVQLKEALSALPENRSMNKKNTNA